jgi:hypothetical protein
MYRPFDCEDQFLARFFHALREHKLDESNTICVIFGDGLRDDLSKSGTFSKRKLWVAYPFSDRNYISRRSTFFDIVPTLTELAGIRYAPMSPFGGPVYEAPNPVPSQKDYDAFYLRFGK